MILLPVLLLAAAPTIIVATPPGPAANGGEDCQVNRIIHAGDPEARLIHPLEAEPEAQALYAVDREVGGCNKPVVLTPKVGKPPVR